MEDVPIGTEDYASVLLEFDSGAHGVLTVNQCAAGRKNRLYYEIDGANCACRGIRRCPTSCGSAAATDRTSCS